MAMYPYLPHTDEDINKMLKTIGVNAIDDLYSDVPELLNRDLNIPNSISEINLKRSLREKASLNDNIRDFGCFRGGGIYNHYIPSIVYQIGAKRGFLTAYTPYQAEVSQGTLQIMYEFQTMISELTGLEVSNSSMYDGATSVAEAILMAGRINKKYKTLIADTIHPEYIEVCETYLKPQEFNLEKINYDKKTGKINITDLKNKINDEISSVVIGYPNFYGIIEDIEEIRKIIPKNILLIVVANPIMLGAFQSPGKLGADIVVGEGQPLGNAPGFGGPGFGFFSSKKEFIRNMPGRIIGKTIDDNGKEGFVMILQTREQHIRREKATSNICSNHAHNALLAAVYMSIMGRTGIKEIAMQNYHKSHYLYNKLIKTEKFEPVFEGTFFNEFALKSKISIDKINKKLHEQKYFGPLNLEKITGEKNIALFCATELNTKEEIDFICSFLEGII